MLNYIILYCLEIVGLKASLQIQVLCAKHDIMVIALLL